MKVVDTKALKAFAFLACRFKSRSKHAPPPLLLQLRYAQMLRRDARAGRLAELVKALLC